MAGVAIFLLGASGALFLSLWFVLLAGCLRGSGRSPARLLGRRNRPATRLTALAATTTASAVAADGAAETSAFVGP